MINWVVRLKNKAWWLAVIPAIAILVQSILQIFGISWDYADLVGKLAAVVESLFAVLVIMGVVADPTVSGYADSVRALGYRSPQPNVKQQPILIHGANDEQ